MDVIPYGHQWIEESDINAVAETLKANWITQGPKIDEFERRVADYCNARYAVAMSNGTAALHAACAVAGISQGSEAITTPITFAATANAIVYCQGKPVFADIKPETLNIDPEEIIKKINAKTKAILPVDFTGLPADLEEINDIAKRRGIVVIEDACHALGAEYKGNRIGGVSDMTVLSFHPVKHITTGEGGMVLTNNETYYDRLKTFRHHGIVKSDIHREEPWRYDIHTLGHNFRITDFQCALGISQMNKLEEFIKRRRDIAARYNKAFSSLPQVVVPAEEKDKKAVYHIYVIQLRLDKLRKGRKDVYKMFLECGIGVNVHYVPLHFHPYYQKTFGYKNGDFPRAESYYESALTLPLFPAMTDDEVNFVIQTVRKIIHGVIS